MQSAVETVKTSLRLPKDTWRRAKIRAMDEGRELQEIVAEAVEAYLKEAERKEGRR